MMERTRGGRLVSFWIPALLLCAGLGSCTGVDTPPGDGEGTSGTVTQASLEDRVRIELDDLTARTSMHAKHLPTGREISVRGDDPMNTLSVIKIPVMVFAFREVEAGRFDMQARYRVAPRDLRRGSGILQQFEVGLEPTYRDLIGQMIATSDNTATDILIDALGMDRINEMLEGLGYADTRLRMTTGELFRETWIRADSGNTSMTDREVFEAGFPSGEGSDDMFFALEGDSTAWLGRSTAREMSRLLEQMLAGELTSEPSVDEMFDILDDQMYNSRIPQRIRFDARIAHKTGDWPPFGANDVGVLFFDGGPIVLSVFTNQNLGDFIEVEATIGRIAELLVQEWGGGR
jgi:beta-lactamase class A